MWHDHSPSFQTVRFAGESLALTAWGIVSAKQVNPVKAFGFALPEAAARSSRRVCFGRLSGILFDVARVRCWFRDIMTGNFYCRVFVRKSRILCDWISPRYGAHLKSSPLVGRIGKGVKNRARARARVRMRARERMRFPLRDCVRSRIWKPRSQEKRAGQFLPSWVHGFQIHPAAASTARIGRHFSQPLTSVADAVPTAFPEFFGNGGPAICFQAANFS